MATVASFNIEYIQYLSPTGELVGNKIPAIAKDYEQLKSLYETMVLTRVFDTKAISLQRTGKLGTYASSLGHEAVHVGIGSAMKYEDVFAPSYREYGVQFCRGVKMSEVLLYWGGDERGSNFSGPPHDFPWCVPIATQNMHAAGAALSFKLRNEPRCAVTVIGDGGSSKGDFLEAINVASAFKLPLVMIIINNGWAISVPRKKQSSGQTLAQKGIAGGLPSIQIDGNDLFAVHNEVKEALQRAREGKGATVIEAITYRLSDHTTADDASRYRPDEEVENAKKFEPILRLRQYLMNNNQWNVQQENKLMEECAKKVEAAVKEYQSAPKLPVTDMFDYMFAELPHDLAEQREFAKELDNNG
ncbi:MAG: pyruvate dehydrogenase (acetyl-transferring) E1 component subunit alpha [Alcanivoracaceae bacterium]|nr:pyruvate dehydrogenase (acetyl-transferring) E1 component subunit alpha [Alcanivoracaceae bacterium]